MVKRRCRRVRRLLQDRLDLGRAGVLPEDLEEHLAACPACASFALGIAAYKRGIVEMVSGGAAALPPRVWPAREARRRGPGVEGVRGPRRRGELLGYGLLGSLGLAAAATLLIALFPLGGTGQPELNAEETRVFVEDLFSRSFFEPVTPELDFLPYGPLADTGLERLP